MGRSEFVGERNSSWDDDPDYFPPQVIQRQPATPAIAVSIDGRFTRIVTKNPISMLTSEEVGLMIESLQEARDFLENH